MPWAPAGIPVGIQIRVLNEDSADGGVTALLDIPAGWAWESAGRCGKEGQAMPVGMGSPHVRIENVVIGGK